MKRFKILAFIALLTLTAFTCIGQNNQMIEITAVGSVIEIEDNIAEVTTSDYAKHLEIDAKGLEVGKEYRFRLIVSEVEKSEKWCSGCTGELKAHVIGFSITQDQAKKDAMRVDKIPWSYSKSPRHH
ncbi:hypothetical protein [Christiangramia sp. SM2212]|uniref:Uncharacterized protein n=1 Tax=Christiangramia sediminicola TaxID=3073267 RepID=A0ABU1EPF1_9FLAO|nr:hypothetical protein [Christiangramia sp. SM2212]MDR5590262.1 hypothetical protein [Christiangramia sp. SM2212]